MRVRFFFVVVVALRKPTTLTEAYLFNAFFNSTCNLNISEFPSSLITNCHLFLLALAYACMSAFIPKYLFNFFLKDNSHVIQGESVNKSSSHLSLKTLNQLLSKISKTFSAGFHIAKFVYMLCFALFCCPCTIF